MNDASNPTPEGDVRDAPGARAAPLLVGLTGAPAAGKSAAAAVLASAGCRVVDVDALGHDVLAEPEVRDAVAATLGAGVLDAEGGIDRRALADLVFRSPDALARLEGIVHPRVRELVVRAVDEARAAGERAVVIDVALLFEGELARRCDTTIAIHAPQDQRITRAAARGWDEGELRRREAQQLSAEDKRSRADRVIVNDGDLALLEERTLRTLSEILAVPERGRAQDDRETRADRAAEARREAT